MLASTTITELASLRDRRGFAVEIAPTIASAETAWRELEAEAAMSPYGRYDWVSAYAANKLAGREAHAAIVRDRSGRAVLILPFEVERRLGLRLGAGVGGKHANYHLPLMRRDILASVSAAEATALLAEIGHAAALDAFALTNMPTEWDGRANPFAAFGHPSPSPAWSLALERDGEATLARSMSREARKKLRNKARGLAKAGSVELVTARVPAQVDEILASFLHQKELRFRELGIANPFADQEMRDFLRAGALARLDEGRPAIELHGLAAAGRIVSVLGGAADAERFSGMFLSFERGELDRFSTGDLLVTGVIRRQCELGRQVFDLGVGDARYKRSICDGVDALVDVIVPITAPGRLYAATRRSAIALKRRVKSSPCAMKAITRMRRWTGTVRA